MKFSFGPLFALATAATMVGASPQPAPATPVPTVHSAHISERSQLEARANAAVVLVDGLRYRTCPRTSCAAIGQYPINTRITLTCYTRDNTTPINGDYGWAKVQSNGYWVALAWGEYVDWSGSLPYC